jgi:uncharacterized protein (DUF885 family)
MKKVFRTTLNGALATILEVSPFLATRLGETGHDDQSDDLSPDGRQAWHAQLEQAITQLDRIDRITLGSAEQLELDALTTLVEVGRRTDSELKITERDPDVYVRELGWALHGVLHRDGSAQERARCLMERLHAVGAMLETAVSNLRRGYDVPPEWTRAAIARLGHLDRFFREELLPFTAETGSAAERFGDAAEGARRKLLRFADFLRDDLLPRCDGSFSVGRSYFDMLLKQQHGLVDGGLEIAQAAEAELQRLRTLLASQAESLGLAADTAGTVGYLQKRNPAASRLLEVYQEELDAAITFAGGMGLAAVPDGAPRTAAEAPAFTHSDARPAAFEPVALLGRPEGLLHVVPVPRDLGDDDAADRLAEHCNYLVQIRAVREGYPGKALHFAYAARGTSRIRRLLRSPSTLEGWGLLSLDLVEEAGGFKNPRLAYMLNVVRMRAALEAVLDVRMHLQTLPYADAVKQLETVGCVRPSVARSTATRLALLPTSGVAAFAGRRELTQLRDEFSDARGARFKPGDLYERVLRMGGAPVGAVREALMR